MGLFKSLSIFQKNSILKNNIQSLFDQIDHLLESARSLFSQSEMLKKVVVEEKDSVQKSSSASTEIASMVAMTAAAAVELSRTAAESNLAVEKSVQALDSLKKMVDIVNESSHSLQRSVGTGLNEIASVTETMAEIKEKAKIINDIVFQTKLLSFNASVEAARAGEHGKGFAVVAEEMGNLARASGEAAKEIESILNLGVQQTREQIESVTSQLDKAAKATIQAIADVDQKSNEISSAFSQLSSFSKVTEEKALEISQATKEQEIGVQEISNSLRELEESSAKLDEMASASHGNSSELAAKVEGITEQFSALARSLGYTLYKTEKTFDFNAAVSAHIDWKMKLSKYLSKPDGSLDPEKVCLDNACMLGKWIYGSGSVHRTTDPELFDSLKDSHANFHRTAGEIVELINRGRASEAAKILGPTGNYMRVSDETVDLIRRIQALSTGGSVKNQKAS